MRFVATDGLPIRFGAEARQFTGEIDDFGPLEKEQKKAIRKGLKVMCRECQMGVAAAQWALADAGLKPGSLDPDRTGISFGADYMLSVPEEFAEGIVQCLDEHGQFQFARWGAEGMAKMSPLWLLKYLPNMPASHLAIYNDFRGPNNSLTMREAAANAALGEAYQIILRGSADVMLVGATGTRLHPMKTIHAVQQEEVSALATAIRPRPAGRSTATAGAWCWAKGRGPSCSKSLPRPRPAGPRSTARCWPPPPVPWPARDWWPIAARPCRTCSRRCCNGAGAEPDDVGHLHAHGLSTRTCDAEEAQAIHEVFAARTSRCRWRPRRAISATSAPAAAWWN